MKRILVEILAAFFALSGCADVRSHATFPVEADGLVRLSSEVLLEKSSGCRIKGGEAMLLDEIIDQGESDLIVFEAESAVSFKFQDGVGALQKGRKLDENSVVQIYASDDREYAPQDATDKDGEVSGGKYINYTHHAVYVIKVTRPGRYTCWTRHYLPRTAGWVYRHQIGDSAVRDITLSNLPAQEWFWTNCGEYDLTEGTHVFNLTNLHGGKRVDKIVLSKDGQFVPKFREREQDKPYLEIDGKIVRDEKDLAKVRAAAKAGEKFKGKYVVPPTPLKEKMVRDSLSVMSAELGPDPSPMTPVKNGFTITEPVHLVGAEKLDALVVYAELNGGAIEVEISTDKTANWQKVPANGDLSGIALAAGADFQEIYFRYNLVREGEDSPKLLGSEISFRAPAVRFAVLENEKAQFTFDTKTGAPCGIVNRKTRQTVQPVGLATDPFEIRLKTPPQEVDGKYPGDPLPEGVTLSLKDARVLSVETGAKSVKTHYALLDGKVLLNTKVTIDETEQTIWTVDVENKSDKNVMWVRYPRLERIKIGEKSTDDVLAWSRIGGEMIPVPSQKGEWSLSYPGRASLSFLDLFDDRGGLYFASYDPDVYAMDIESRPRVNYDHIDLSMRKRHRIKQGEKYSWDYAVAPHAGSWHWGADRYREFFHRTFGRPDYPQWLTDCDGWIAASYMHRNLGKTTYEEEYRKGFDAALRYGYWYVQTWATTGRGACPSYYLPLKELGGAESFTKINKWWHDLGGKVGYYFHGNAIGAAHIVGENYWTTPWTEYPEHLRPPSWDWYVRNRSYGKPDIKIDKNDFVKRYNAAIEYELQKSEKPADRPEFAGMDSYERMTMFEKDWPEYQTKWAMIYNDEYYADVIYWDTFAWGGDQSEFNPYMKCFGEGNVTPKRIAFLQGCIDRGRKTNPDYYQLTEGCVDIYGLTCFHMISGFTRHPEVFRYTLPEQIVFEGHQNGGWGSHQAAYGRIASAFLYGNKFDMYDHLLASTEVRDIVYMRKWFSNWQNSARFMDNLGVTVDSPNVQAKVHWVDNRHARGVILTLRNETGLEGVRVTLDASRYLVPKRAMLFELGKEPTILGYGYRDGRLSFAAPKARLAAVVFVERADGPLAWNASVLQDESDGIKLQIANFGGAAIRAGLTCAGETAVLDVAGGKTGSKHFRPADFFSLAETRLIEVSAKVGDERKDLFMGQCPVVNDPSFEFGGTESDEARDGKKVKFLATGQNVRIGLALKQGKKFRLSFRIKQDKGGAAARVRTMSLGPRFWGTDPARFEKSVAVPKTTGEWTTAEIEFVSTGRGDLHVDAGRQNTGVLIDDIRVEEIE